MFSFPDCFDGVGVRRFSCWNKNKMFKAVIFSVLVAAALASEGAGWKYGTTGYGPDDWGKVSAHCSESAQSPINIETSTVKKNSNLKGLRFTCDNKYGKVSGKMVNNGHAPTLVINKVEGTAKLTGGPLGDNVYRLQQLHFHFGCDDDKGSEHTVNGEAYSGELHLVTYNTKYPDFATAVDKPDGLSVIGVFLQEDDDDKASYSLRMLSNAMWRIREPDTGVMVRRTFLYNLVPQLKDLSRTSFYSYKGSLTTPPCYQSVNWIVLKRPIPASESVLKKMRRLRDHEEHSMCENCSPLNRSTAALCLNTLDRFVLSKSLGTASNDVMNNSQ
ncbi:Carbonic anhydrase [Desmophyllum pertusum]|uniref:Carbonic anhydrase n=1 Tax=Desmophyllum pertusum TaxID=174260 RepID=A0A9W9Z1B8_9CNID|nr:Carbonic anhydrase [Desmophyllum pertusum]